jgi:hypothetical protein
VSWAVFCDQRRTLLERYRQAVHEFTEANAELSKVLDAPETASFARCKERCDAARDCCLTCRRELNEHVEAHGCLPAGPKKTIAAP